MFEKVLLAVDGSDHSAKAVPVAADIAKKSNSEVLVFHAREYAIARGVAGNSRVSLTPTASSNGSRRTSSPLV